MRGVAKVHWTESRSTGTRLGSYTEHYNAEVEYFFKRQVLVGGGMRKIKAKHFGLMCTARIVKVTCPFCVNINGFQI